MDTGKTRYLQEILKAIFINIKINKIKTLNWEKVYLKQSKQYKPRNE